MRLDQLPEYHAPCWEAHYENDCERGKRTTRQLLEPWSRVMTVLESDASVAAWIEHLGYQVETDPTHHGGGLHVTEPGGWLNVHLDYDRHPIVPRTRRALNLIAFLNPEWKESYGGALILCASGGTPFKRVYPAPGRLFAFEVSDVSYHGVEQVTGPIPRVTCACYFLAPATGRETRTRALFMPTRGSPSK
jgi:Rps23 Pro-64 3,4-dihydroxylase Tpa1-like proline 4-hydroxylase